MLKNNLFNKSLASLMCLSFIVACGQGKDAQVPSGTKAKDVADSMAKTTLISANKKIKAVGANCIINKTTPNQADIQLSEKLQWKVSEAYKNTFAIDKNNQILIEIIPAQIAGTQYDEMHITAEIVSANGQKSEITSVKSTGLVNNGNVLIVENTKDGSVLEAKCSLTEMQNANVRLKEKTNIVCTNDAETEDKLLGADLKLSSFFVAQKIEDLNMTYSSYPIDNLELGSKKNKAERMEAIAAYAKALKLDPVKTTEADLLKKLTKGSIIQTNVLPEYKVTAKSLNLEKLSLNISVRDANTVEASADQTSNLKKQEHKFSCALIANVNSVTEDSEPTTENKDEAQTPEVIAEESASAPNLEPQSIGEEVVLTNDPSANPDMQKTDEVNAPAKQDAASSTAPTTNSNPVEANTAEVKLENKAAASNTTSSHPRQQALEAEFPTELQAPISTPITNAATTSTPAKNNKAAAVNSTTKTNTDKATKPSAPMLKNSPLLSNIEKAKEQNQNKPTFNTSDMSKELSKRTGLTASAPNNNSQAPLISLTKPTADAKKVANVEQIKKGPTKEQLTGKVTKEKVEVISCPEGEELKKDSSGANICLPVKTAKTNVEQYMSSVKRPAAR